MHQPNSSGEGSRNSSGPAVQMSLPGLTVFSVSLVVASSLLTWFLAGRQMATDSKSAGTIASEMAARPVNSSEKSPPWGDLIKYDIQLERPEEYAAFEFNNSHNRDWNFGAVTPEQAGQFMANCGLPTNLVEHALSPELARIAGGKFLVTPDEELILSLTPEARERLYDGLAQQPENYYMHSPFSFPTDEFTDVFEGGNLNQASETLIKKLAYRRGERTYFSDLGFVLDRIPTEEGRLHLVKALSRLSAVMVRLRISPSTDIDKLVNYWASAPGVRPKDLRPLLESVQRMDGGGTVSLVYLLPPFARKRLFTFPLSSKFGEAEVDCHWSTMNFFRETPDNRFADLNYTSAYIATNYYSIAKPSFYGDLIFVLDEKGGAIHSAVYIADDIVFTKNGRSYGQPWLLMHLKDVVTAYSTSKEPRLVFYRNKTT